MRNRHLPGWRFLLFTMIVTVKGPICNVIRMCLTPFQGLWLTACLLCSACVYFIQSAVLCQFQPPQRGGCLLL